MSTIGWVDYSSTERERVTQVLAMLQEKGTLDELGIGQIRDAFADKLFPGFSTIQTRAKYLVTIPYMFEDYRNLAANERASLTTFLHQREDELARALINNHANDIPNGIIGKESLDKGVSRKPSSVYWNGLRQLGIANTALSLKEFASQFEQLANSSHEYHEDDDKQASNLSNLMTKSTDYQDNWLEMARIELTRKEAEFIKDKLQLSKKIEHSIPAQLIKHDLLSKALASDDAVDSGTWRLEALQVWLSDSNISQITKSMLEKALEFSFVIEGAHIRYNMLIASRAKNNTYLQELSEEFKEWQAQVSKYPDRVNQKNIEDWYCCAFGEGGRANHRTRTFIENWCQLINKKVNVEQLDACVEKQAIANKGARSLLKKALDEDQRWVGMRRLEFRWPTVKVVLQDIQEGLNVSA